ncbi:DUF998 domain-containing protein [Pseudonocardia sp. 73-21]|uniref:DUF998 domain-containing protein n=1 Tax=Pseudonocardia sp. 73-21 TaxID=1895809 RepID=UPI0026164A41|nr:DUF998 domain-containing protein [Pseudonocardia sp. 73-21]
MTWPRPDPKIAVTGVVLFWGDTLVAGSLAPGYDLTSDYVSSLAGRGSAVAPVGIVAIVFLGLAHVLAAATLRGALGAPLALAGVAGLTIASFRTGCPLGAAGCGTAPNTVDDLPGTVHGLAVGAYEIAIVAAMLLFAFTRRRDEKVFAPISVVVAVVSVVLLLQTGAAYNGLWQRGWLLVNTGWLVAVLLTRKRVQRRREPAPPGVPAGW